MKIIRHRAHSAQRIPLLIFFLGLTPLAFAADSATIVARANNLYTAGKLDEALTLYQQALQQEPNSPAVNFNIGTAEYKKGEFEKAIASFEKASVSIDKKLEEKAAYNIGNAKYKLGKRKENTDLSAAVDLLGESLEYYKRAIELNDKDKNAKANYELVQRERKELLDKLKQHPEKKSENGGMASEKKNTQGSESSQQQEKQPQEKQGENKNQEDGEKKALQAEKEKEDLAVPSKESVQEKPKGEKVKEMTPEEAKMLLEGYRQEEDAKGQVKFKQKEGVLGEPEKDW